MNIFTILTQHWNLDVHSAKSNRENDSVYHAVQSSRGWMKDNGRVFSN
jgi:hypothetical protein